MAILTTWSPPPTWLAPATSTRRPRALPLEPNHGAGLCLLALEQRVDAGRSKILAAREAIARNQDLVHARKAALIAAKCRETWCETIAHEYSAAGRISASHRQARQNIANALAERERQRPIQRQARLDRIGDLLLGLSDQKREQVLLAALQNGDVDVLESVVCHPAALESVGVKLSGSTTATNRGVIAERFARVILPTEHQVADELEGIAAAAATTLSFANWKLERELGVPVADLDRFATAKDLAAGWSRDGLDVFAMSEPYHRAQVRHGNKGDDADAKLDEAADLSSPLDEAALAAAASKLVVTEAS